jgi:hypothetical protein
MNLNGLSSYGLRETTPTSAGVYPEDESRLSDTTLDWMIEEVTKMPHPLLVNRPGLHLFPDAGGMQHSEVESARQKWPKWMPAKWALSWNEKPRVEAVGAPWYKIVEQRFALPGVIQYAAKGPYRPVSKIRVKTCHIY